MPTSLELKYVMIDYTMPIVFIAPHHRSMMVHGNITSAGFLKLVSGVVGYDEFHNEIREKFVHVETYGYSRSLDMRPDPDDTFILEKFFGLQ